LSFVAGITCLSAKFVISDFQGFKTGNLTLFLVDPTPNPIPISQTLGVAVLPLPPTSTPLISIMSDIPFVFTPVQVQHWDRLSLNDPARIVNALNLVATDHWNDTTLVRVEVYYSSNYQRR
jgi:hypothetical protein